jgi:hypothetical protein
MPIPAALWDELKAQRLLPPDAPVPERAPRVSAGAAAVGT